MDKKISVVLATYNEEKNIAQCLESVHQLADEIVVVDGSSTDGTRKIAESFGARVIKRKNYSIFHINKQYALKEARHPWILQLDADERVSRALREEIKRVVGMTDSQIDKHQVSLSKRKLFLRHQRLLEGRDGRIGTGEGEYAAFFIPRLNLFLGKYLRYGGVYPDGVIRLVKKGRVRFPAKSVHEQIVVDGRVGWLANPLLHMDSPTFRRYFERNSRYIDLIRDELRKEKSKNLFKALDFLFVKPIFWLFWTQIRHKGILDGWRGVVFSLFSALRFPRAYYRYLRQNS